MTKKEFMKQYINDYYDKKYRERAIDRTQQAVACNSLNESAKYRKRLNVRY